MATITIVDPVTRIEGHLKVDLTIDTVRGVQQVIDARCSGTLFRGFEKVIIGRDPQDAQHITERICGVCPISHALAAVMALDGAAKVQIPKTALLLRNLVMGANFVDSHILHFYLLSALDYIDGPAQGPWQTAWAIDRRFNAAQTNTLISHYLKAIEMKRKAQEAAAIFGGRMPHAPAYIAGGFTNSPTQSQINLYNAYVDELLAFINSTYLPDAEALYSVYNDYKRIGTGYGNLLAYGCFDEDVEGKTKLFKSGYSTNFSATPSALQVASITEHVKFSWYSDKDTKLKPSAGVTNPVNPKTNAYSWLKAPRYNNLPMEVGPLARMWMTGDYISGISVMDRHRARAYEALKIAEAMKRWIGAVKAGDLVYTRPTIPQSATTMGLTEAPRGALGHWGRIANGKIANYQIITPTCWNCSPCDDDSNPGPLEQALLGTPIQDASKPVEALRVVHSFDPCLDCAVHVARAK